MQPGEAGSIILLPGADIGVGGGSIPPSYVDPVPGGQILIRGGDVSLSADNGNLPTVVSAIPEPESNAMLLAGLGVICAVAGRRKANKFYVG